MPDELSKLKRHRYRISFNGADLGPLIGEPEIAIHCKCFENRSFDPATSGDPGSAHAPIVDAFAAVTLCTGDISGALTLLAGFAVGDDVLDPRAGHALVLAPPAGSGEKVLAFANACLLPELEYSPKARNHAAKLRFQARPDGSGRLFTFTTQGN